MRNLMVIY